jgi:hypothetical protein
MCEHVCEILPEKKCHCVISTPDSTSDEYRCSFSARSSPLSNDAVTLKRAQTLACLCALLTFFQPVWISLRLS